MSWIENAQSQAKMKAQEAEAKRMQEKLDREHFQEEEVTPKLLADFLEIYKAPMTGIVSDLKEAGYLVEEVTDYLRHSDADDNQKSVNLNKYSLRTTKPSYRGLTDYRVDVNYIFGTQWYLKNSEGIGLGVVKIYPTANGRTHFGGAEYTVPNTNFNMEVSELEDQDEVIDALKGVISNLIEAQLLQETNTRL